MFSATMVSIPGRLHEIRVFHTIAPHADYIDATLRTVYKIHQANAKGDILAFFNGQEDIEIAASLLKQFASQIPNLVVSPLYANLPMGLQKKVFHPVAKGFRKVILSTNIAETSVTIPGIRYVVDNGLAKMKFHFPRVGLEALLVHPISQASALQRAGRAGREAPGQVFRLYTEEDFNRLEKASTAEIKRTNLANVVLQLKASGIDDVMNFEFIERPSREGLVFAHQQLVLLGAVSKSASTLTDLGKRMSRYPLEPKLSCILASALEVTLDHLSFLSLLSQDAIFYTPSSEAQEEAFEKRKKFYSNDGDLITWLNVVRAFEEYNGDEAWCRLHYVNFRNLLTVLVRLCFIILYFLRCIKGIYFN
jgi:HrpA-like RNA helicase